MPKNPYHESGYTAVTVLAWSQGLEDIYETIQLLDSNVRVVNAEDFIELVTMNLKPAGSTPSPLGRWNYGPGDVNRDSRVDMVDLAIMAQQWLECTQPGRPECISYIMSTGRQR